MKITKIYGGPGAGKTTRLVELIRQAVDAGTPVNRIAFISHTTAAADEAWQRVRDQLGVKFKPRYFCTIHSAAMNRAGITRNDVFSNWAEVSRRTRLKFTGQGMSAALDDNKTDQNRNGDHILVLKNYASSNMITIEEAKERLPRYAVLSKANVGRTLRIFEEIKNEEKRFDFDDMLNIYNDDPEASALPVDIVFVDEAQDLSKLQWSVVHKLAKEAGRLYIVGDDDQAIYTFLGADPYGFLDHEADETIILDRSWRVPASIGVLADKIIRQVSKRQHKEFEWRSDLGDLKYHQGDPWPVLRDPQGSTMVLARHKKQCWTLSHNLDKHNIPHSINGESPLHGTRAERLRSFLELREGRSVTLTRAADAVSLLPKQRERLEKMRNRARREPDFCVSKEDIGIKWDRPWFEIAAKSERDVTSNLKVRKHLNHHGLDILGVAPAIDISTIHAAKGREADHVVLLTDCYKSVWEEQRRSMESELRLAYVGVTRAKQKLTIVRPKTTNYLRALV